MHTDKTFYVTGESIWFKAYCVDENFHKPSAISKIAYVEIFNKENKAVLQAKIAMKDGSGNGSFIIPSFVSSGNYTLRAYTRWMTNFNADYFFETPLIIFNNLKAGVLSQVLKRKTYTVSFFPEGGNLVEGITSKLAFKAVDDYGEPATCSGIIMDSHNKHIADFHSFKFGMGSFNFTPQTSENYKAVIKFADTTFEVKLPVAYTKGYVIHLEDADDAHIKITLNSNTQSDDVLYALTHSQNVMKDFKQVTLLNGKAIFTIDKSKLSTGISDITIFNSNKQPVCERLYFKQPNDKLNIQIQPDKDLYQTKKQVNISLNATANSNLSAMADMSVSVFMIDSLQPAFYNDILSYIFLTSELKGKISSPEYYFQSNNKDVAEAADNLMLTQGWRRFKWEDILQNKKPYFEFIPEAEDVIINGKIISKYNGFAGKNINATLTVPASNFQLSNTTSDDSGKLNFNVKNFYGINNIIIKTDSNYTVELTSPFTDKFSTNSNAAFKIPVEWKQQLLFRSINTQTDNAYFVDKKQHSYLYNAEDTSLFYGKPDKRYYLDNYTRFTTMEEVMREYITEVRVRKTGEQFHFKVIDLPTKSFLNNDPLILLNGIPVANPDAIMQFNPLKIKRLDVVGRKYYYGNTVNDGIVSYTTYDGDLGSFPLSTGTIIIQFDGLQREREFYSPVYADNQETHIPDFRNVLFWSPFIKTDANGKAAFSFYTSEIKGKFACVIQGITPDGFAGSNIVVFDVKN